MNILLFTHHYFYAYGTYPVGIKLFYILVIIMYVILSCFVLSIDDLVFSVLNVVAGGA